MMNIVGARLSCPIWKVVVMPSALTFLEKEPDIFNAIKFGTVLENVVFDEHTREVDYTDKSVTENTRAAYPIEYIPNPKVPCVSPHPNDVILACDAFGVLPAVSKLNLAQTMYHFISGYTTLVTGTEEGIKEPQATISACFGVAFIMLQIWFLLDILFFLVIFL